MGAPRLLASLAASAHAVIRLVQILRLAPFHLGPVTQGGADPPRPPPDIWCCCGGRVAAAVGLLLLLLLPPAGCCWEQEDRSDGSSTLKGHTGRATRGRRAGPGRLPEGSQPARVPLTHTKLPRAEEGGGPTTLEGRTTPGGERRQARPAPHELKSSYPFLVDRFHRFPGGGAPRPRVPKTWIRERTTAVRHRTISSHRSMHPPGRTRGGRELVTDPSAEVSSSAPAGHAHTYTQQRRVDGRPPPVGVCWSQYAL